MKNVIICGLGAVGMTYASKLGGKSRGKCNLKILVNEERLERYSKNKPILNGVEQDFNYILPDDNFDADLIIIATKASGLDSAVKILFRPKQLFSRFSTEFLLKKLSVLLILKQKSLSLILSGTVQ